VKFAVRISVRVRGSYSETNLVCNPCVIYLASEKLHISHDYFTR